MKKLCSFTLLSLLLVKYGFANCDFVVVTSDPKFPPHARVEQLGGFAMAPLCSDLPDELRTGTYRKYCDNSPSFNPSATIYAPYSDYSCTAFVNSEWGALMDHKLRGKHIISESEGRGTLIKLTYPKDFIESRAS